MVGSRTILIAYILVAFTLAILIAVFPHVGPTLSAAFWQKFHYDPLSFILIAAPAAFLTAWLVARAWRRSLLTAYFRILAIVTVVPLALWFLLGFMR